MMSVIAAAIALIILGYSAVGFSGYLAFPRTVSSNVLKNFSDRDVLMQVSLVGLAGSTGHSLILLMQYAFLLILDMFFWRGGGGKQL